MTQQESAWLHERISTSELMADVIADKRNPFSEMDSFISATYFPTIEYLKQYKQLLLCDEESYRYELMKELDIRLPSGLLITGPDRYLLGEMLIKDLISQKKSEENYSFISFCGLDILSMKEFQPDGRKLCDSLINYLIDPPKEYNTVPNDNYIIYLENLTDSPYCQLFIHELLNYSECCDFYNRSDETESAVRRILVVCVNETRQELNSSVSGRMQELRCSFPSKEQRLQFLQQSLGIKSGAFKKGSNSVNLKDTAEITEGFSYKALFDFSNMLKIAIWEENQQVRATYSINKDTVGDISDSLRNADVVSGEKITKTADISSAHPEELIPMVLKSVGEAIDRLGDSVSKIKVTAGVGAPVNYADGAEIAEQANNIPGYGADDINNLPAKDVFNILTETKHETLPLYNPPENITGNNNQNNEVPNSAAQQTN